MKLITILSAKGGVGKSALALGLGSAFAHAGKRVCMVDLDVFNRTLSNPFFDPNRPTLLDVLTLKRSMAGAAYEVRLGLFLVAGNKALAPVEESEVAAAWRRLPDCVKSLGESDFDVVILDVAAGWQLPVQMAVRCAINAPDGLLLVPVAPAIESLESAEGTRRAVAALAQSEEERTRVQNRLYGVATMRPGDWDTYLEKPVFEGTDIPWLSTAIPLSKSWRKLAFASQTPYEEPSAWRVRRVYEALRDEIVP